MIIEMVLNATMEDLLTFNLFGNLLANWLAAFAVTSGVLVLFYAFKRVAMTRLSRLASRTAAYWDDSLVELLARTHFLFLIVVALYIGSLMLAIPDTLRRGLFTAAAIALVVQAGIWLNNFIVFWLKRDLVHRKEKDPASVATVTAAAFVGRLVLWSVVALLILENLGVDVTALVAGLGIGGVAVALAVQNILGDLFASLSIVLDKPFAVGDFLIVDDLLGSVEHVGLKTTRLRSLSGEQLVFSNADLLGSRIRNYGRMYERRVVFNIGVTYQTYRDKLRLIPSLIRETIEELDKVRFDRSHFKGYGDFALTFETVYYVLSPDYTLYMDIQEAINLRIHEHFEREGIEFAYPTQTLFIEKTSNQLGAVIQ